MVKSKNSKKMVNTVAYVEILNFFHLKLHIDLIFGRKISVFYFLFYLLFIFYI